MIKGKTILITGGCGWISTNLSSMLCKNNKILLYDLNKNVAGKTTLLDHKNVKFIKGDVLDSKHLNKCCKGVDIVIHMASVAHVENIYRDPYMNMKILLDGTKNALDASVSNKVKKFIYFSTSEVYGPYAYAVKEELATKQGSNGDLRWTYSVGKVAGEHLCKFYGGLYNLDYTIVRPFNVMGEGQDCGAFYQMIKNAYINGKMIVNGDGSQVRAYCHIQDFCLAILKIMSSKKTKKKTYNIGNPNNAVTMQELAYKLKYLLGNQNVSIENVTYVGEDVQVRVPCIDNITKDTGWTPQINLNTATLGYIRWMKDYARRMKYGQG